MVYDTINPQVLNLILKSVNPGMRILDVGCGTGRLGRELKSKVGCRITGLEIDREAAEIARDSYDELVVVNLEELLAKKSCLFKTEVKYDFIIFADILEHVTNPAGLLRCFETALAENGFIIVSIPNAANWMVRLRLLFGNFDYSGGILDQGHLRFFTYKTAKKLLEKGGYKIISVVNNNATWIMRLLGRAWKGMFAFQFVFKCVKK